ncbi:integrase/recombinase [Pandoraea communis]|uniref:Integrase/recombinase n=1 Tax=Pandoraea communis TaxID=2508297 RepID=A0A5E4YLD7_9BURK|nr:site-specific integrase [Pandoraea communis]VVE49180.1 integrase/recombinase [Pandoraea communis]
MASIVQVGTRWRAQVRREGKSIAKTFRTKAQASTWAREIEVAVDEGRNLDKVSAKTLVPAIIAHYRILREESKRPVRVKSTEDYTLKQLAEHFNGVTIAELTPKMLVKFAQARHRAGAGAATVNMDISKLGTVLRHTSSFLDFDVPDVIGKARPMLHHLRLIGSSGKRERRPTADEIARIMAWDREHPEYTLPLADVIEINGQSGFRRGEIFRIEWRDLDEINRMVLVRDRKDPRNKVGNNEWVPLIGTSLDVIKRQSKVDGEQRIFPFSPQTASKYFKMACDSKGIVDLHLHDLRHEAASALFEAGWGIAEVAGVTGHKDWRHLKRYTNLQPEDLAEKGKLLPFKKNRRANGS